MAATSVIETGRLVKKAGRYAIFDEIAAGGMATVHFGCLTGPAGFSRIVAIKRMHPHLARQADFTAMLLDEARLASRIRHQNVVPTLEVVEADGEIFVVMEYVQGESLAFLRRAVEHRNERLPLPVATSITLGMLQGLHAAHEARDERGEPLGIVHRDVSPHNVLVGVDGVARVLDFGVAKAVQNLHQTAPGTRMGKSAYMAPEQIQGKEVTRLSDIFPAGIVLWELLTGKRLFEGQTDEQLIYGVLTGTYPKPSDVATDIPPGLDQIVMKALERDPQRRFATALEFALAIEQWAPIASPRKVGEYVTTAAAETLGYRAELIRQIEVSTVTSVSSPNMQLRLEDDELRAGVSGDTMHGSDRDLTVPDARISGTGDETNPTRVALPPASRSFSRPTWLIAAASAVIAGVGTLLVYPHLATAPRPIATASPPVDPEPIPPLPTVAEPTPTAPDPSATPPSAASARKDPTPPHPAAPGKRKRVTPPPPAPVGPQPSRPFRPTEL